MTYNSSGGYLFPKEYSHHLSAHFKILLRELVLQYTKNLTINQTAISHTFKVLGDTLLHLFYDKLLCSLTHMQRLTKP
jgi:hypothetical protein